MRNQDIKMGLRLGLVLLAVFSGTGTAQAATITVTNTNAASLGSLRQAIFDAQPGDTIDFDLPQCTPDSPCNIQVPVELIIDKDLTIQGPGADRLILDGLVLSRIFRVNNGITATIDGLRIFGGLGASSGGGGGILNSGGNVTIRNCVIDHNRAPNSGGGVLNNNGGIVTIINTTISENTANFNGGGVANNASSSMKVINSTVALNFAGGLGGGISNLGPLTVTNSTIYGNTAGFPETSSGSGINAGGSETISNTIIAGNTSGFTTSDDVLSFVEAASHNLIGDAATSGGILHGVNGNIVGSGGFGTMPIDAVFAVFVPSDVGGSTLTMALAAGSPAIDAGSNALALDGDGNPLLTDQRGAGFPRVTNSAVDIGAFERQMLFSFTGFFHPIENMPVVNTVTAGSAIPIRFNLGGFWGTDIFALGFPSSGPAICSTAEPAGEVDETVLSGGSSLNYDPITDRYTYVWKTNRAWKGTCRLLVVRFNDGTEQQAKFRFR